MLRALTAPSSMASQISLRNPEARDGVREGDLNLLGLDLLGYLDGLRHLRLLNGLQRQAGQPGALLRRLAQQDPVVDHWLAMHPRRQETDLQLLLP